MKSLPIRRAQFKTAEFAVWLASSGAELGKPTNPYEVIRYLAHDGGKKAATHIVYAKENGMLTYCGRSREHYMQFLGGVKMYPEPGAGNPPGGWVKPAKKSRQKEPEATDGEKRRKKLLARDGDTCWFCGTAMGDDCTIEHLVPRSAGGRNTLANYALAHAACNHRAANLPLVEKIEMRAKLRGAVPA